MTDNIVERAAKALWNRREAEIVASHGTRSRGSAGIAADWKRTIEDVHTVIAALREPSEAMIEAGDEDTGGWADAADIWRAMIDCLLDASLSTEGNEG